MFAVRHIGIADNKIARRHRVFVIANDITPALFGNVKQLQSVGVAMNHMRMLLAVLLIDENYINQLNFIHEPPLPKTF